MSRRILLVNPHDTRQGNYSPPPTGLLYLHSMLAHNGCEAEWVDGNMVGLEGIRAAMHAFNPDVVGISIMTPGRHKGLEVARFAKERGCRTIFGGAHATLMYEQLLTVYSNLVDLVCVGDGEWTILGVAKEDLAINIPGLAWRDCQGKVVRTTPKISSINDYPYPSWDTVDWPAYNAGSAGPRVIFTRGCSWGRCMFCSVGVQKHGYQVRSPENVVGELEWLVEMGQPDIAFADDTFSGDIDAAKALCRLIIERGIKISYYATTRVNCVDPELLGLMKRSGNYEISYGLESGDPDTLRVYAKGASLAQAEQALRWTREAGIKTCGLVIYNGIRGKKADPVTRNWLNRLGTVSGVGSVDQLWVLPGTALYRAMKAHGHIDDEFWLGPEPYQVYKGQLDHLTPQEWGKYHGCAA
jgi:anaerobic magnesium-protoporphyrin IX monomethyl ester cyclase